jgi:hypothetical protein
MGVWEAMFSSEEESWVDTVVDGVSTVTNLAIELPCTLLALISTALLLVWDYTCQGAQQVSDALGLEEWWALEHTLWTLLILQSLPLVLKRAKGDKGKMLLQILSMVQILCTWGALIFYLNGLQGGVIFGGNLSHPSMAFLALIVQVIMITLRQMRIDMAGIGHDKDVSDERFKAMYGVYDMAVKYEEAGFLLIAVFGLPRLDLEALMADPTPLLAAIPFLGLAYDWKKFEGALFPEEKVETVELANGAPPKFAEEAIPEEPVPEADQPEPELEPEEKEAEADDPEVSFKTDTDETKTEETEAKVDESEKIEEVVPEPVVTKVSLITKIKGAVCGLIGKIVGFLNCILTKVLSLINLIVTKVLSLVNLITDAIKALPWDCIVGFITTYGITAGVTYAYWILTVEDNLVFVAPSIGLLAPLILGKVQEKNWLDAKGAHLTNEILKTVSLGVHYYIYKTYISLAE